MNNEPKEWEKDFDKRFGAIQKPINDAYLEVGGNNGFGDRAMFLIKAFISTTVAEAEKRAREEVLKQLMDQFNEDQSKGFDRNIILAGLLSKMMEIKRGIDITTNENT